MAASVKHHKQTALPNDASKEISADAWNEEHDVTGLGGAALLDVGTAAGTVAAGDDSRLSDARTPTAHTHSMTEVSDITAAGRAILDDASNTDQRTTLGLGGAAVLAVGTIAGTVAAGDDARLSDARTPLAHTHSMTEVSDITAAGRAILDDANNTVQRATLGLGGAAILDVGTIAGTVAAGDDSRLSDARTPVAHTQSGTTVLFNATDKLLGRSSAGAGAGEEIALTAVGRALIDDATVTAQRATLSLGDMALVADAASDGNTYGRKNGAWANAAGTDLWTYVRLTNDASTTLTAGANITSLSFVPAKNTNYEIEGHLMLRTATATCGPQPGIAWPTSPTEGTCWIQVASSATAIITANGNIRANVMAVNTGVPTTTGSWPAIFGVLMLTGANCTGSLFVRLASESAGTATTIVAGSYFKYRTFT